ncbi:hypothetical protein [Streptomyces sp. NPDC003393]
MSQTEIDVFYKLASSLDPLQVSGYLEAQGWDLLERHEAFLEYWLEPGHRNDPERETSPYLLPLDISMRNFQRRFVEFLTELADYYECSAEQLGERLREKLWDAFLIHLTEDGANQNSIGLALAGSAMQVGFNLVRISALYTANPWRSLRGGGARGATVNRYLSESVRLGHTERGSYVIPILSVAHGAGDSSSQFGRRVFENLAKGLQRISQLPAMLEGARGEQSGSAGHFEVALVHAMRAFNSLPQAFTFDLSFRWAARRGLPPDIPRKSISFNPEMIHMLSELTHADQLIEHEEASLATGMASYGSRPMIAAAHDLAELTGKVIAFGTDDRQIRSFGSPYFVVVRGEFQSEIADIRVVVSEEEYDLAIRSREQDESVTASGYFSNGPAGWHLEGELRFSPRLVSE